jgi:tol-pal system protein YbgF
MKLHALAAAAAFTFLVAPAAQAALFEDDEARRAILDLRQRVEAQRLSLEGELRRSNDENATLRRSLLDLQNQIEALRRQKDIAQGVEERFRKFEPVQVQVDGREFAADPAEQKEFEAALGAFRKGEFMGAQSAFSEFLRKFPQSGYRPSGLFWLGNAQYANRDYRGAIANFRALLQQAPDHPRAPEAVLSIANCQIELKDNASARKTLDDLVKAYPQSEAASAAKERLARLR